MGYVERVDGGWGWHTRMIPGPYGEFASGVCPSEFEARRVVETKWLKYLPTEPEAA